MHRRGIMARLVSNRPATTIPQLESISAHLQDLFNSSQGSCHSPGGAGLPPIADMIRDFPQAARSLETSIRNTIAIHEPRLQIQEVKATQIEAEPKIYIEIHAKILGPKGQGQPVLLLSELDHTGRVQMQ